MRELEWFSLIIEDNTVVQKKKKKTEINFNVLLDLYDLTSAIVLKGSLCFCHKPTSCSLL